MNQDLNNNNGQVTQSGNIVVCHGASECPIVKNSEPESKLQAEFYRHTGIWAPSGARVELERLMRHNGFTAPRLRAAWQANSLLWDGEANRLVTKTYWIEPAFGYSGAALAVAYLFLHVLAELTAPPGEALRRASSALIALALYGGVTWMMVRYVITPYAVAKRARSFLDRQHVDSSDLDPD